jgi:hypothetical protein
MYGISYDNILVQQHFPHISFEQEITFEDSNPTFESAIASLENQPEAWYHIPNKAFFETCCITCLYAKLLGQLPIYLSLPRRRASRIRRHEKWDNIIVDFVEDLIETALQEIHVPLDKTPLTPGPTPLGSRHNFDNEHSISNSENSLGEN